MGRDQVTEPGAFPGNVPSQRHQRENGAGAALGGFEQRWEMLGTTWKNDPGKAPALPPPSASRGLGS